MADSWNNALVDSRQSAGTEGSAQDGGLKYLIPGYSIYKWGFSDPAEQQKQAAGEAIRGLSGLGSQYGQDYSRMGNRAQSYYGPANQALNFYRNNQPNQLGSLYGATSQYYRPASADVYSSAYSMRPNYLQEFYGQQQIGPSILGSLYNTRSAAGYGESPLTARYQQAQQAPGYLTESTYRQGQNLMGWSPLNQRIVERDISGRNPQNDPLMEALAMRRGTVNSGGFTDELARSMGGRDFTSTSMNYMRGLQERTLDPELAAVYQRQMAGQTATAQLANEVAGNRTALGGARFDPTQTQGLGETYRKIAAEQPGLQEQFVGSALQGENPYFERLSARTRESARRAAAARGTFLSGLSARQENDAEAALRAQQFQQMGELTGQAEGARRARLGQQLGAAGALDQQILAQRGLSTNIAEAQDRMRQGLASEQDRALLESAQARAQIGLGKEGILSGLAKFGDTQRLQQAGLESQLAGEADRMQEARRAGLERMTGAESARRAEQQAALDRLIGQQSGERLQGFGMLAGLATSRDQLQAQRESELNRLAQGMETAQFGRQQAMDTLGMRADEEARARYAAQLNAAQGASQEQGQFLTTLGGLAGQTDTANQQYRNYLESLAGGASREQQGYLGGLLGGATTLGEAEAGTQRAYDLASMQSRQQLDVGAIETKLKAAGIDAQTRQQLINSLLSAGSIAAKASA